MDSIESILLFLIQSFQSTTMPSYVMNLQLTPCSFKNWPPFRVRYVNNKTNGVIVAARTIRDNRKIISCSVNLRISRNVSWNENYRSFWNWTTPRNRRIMVLIHRAVSTEMHLFVRGRTMELTNPNSIQGWIFLGQPKLKHWLLTVIDTNINFIIVIDSIRLLCAWLFGRIKLAQRLDKHTFRFVFVRISRASEICA